MSLAPYDFSYIIYLRIIIIYITFMSSYYYYIIIMIIYIRHLMKETRKNIKVTRQSSHSLPITRYLVVCGIRTGILFSNASYELSRSIVFHFQVIINAILVLYLQLIKLIVTKMSTTNEIWYYNIDKASTRAI